MVGNDPVKVMDRKDTVYATFVSVEDAIRWLDHLLDATKGYSLMNELNTLQSDDRGNTVFESKFDIPVKILNLVLRQHGLKLAVSRRCT